MYKLSKFNVLTQVGDDTYALYNTNTCALAQLTKHQQLELYNPILLQSQEYQATELFGALVDNGFVLQDTVDEEESIAKLEQDMSSPYTLSLVILPTENCNFRCVYCYEEHKNNMMQDDGYQAILRYIKSRTQLKYLSIAWFGGEPLLCRDKVLELGKALVEYCKFNSITLQQGMTTNGYLLTSELMQELLAINIDKYQITVDGIKTEHDTKRYLANGQGTWDTITHNLKAIKSVKGQFELTIRYNYDNNSDIVAFLHTYKEMFGDDYRYKLHLVSVGDWSPTDSSDTSRVDLDISNVLAMAHKMGIRLSNVDSFRNSLSMICYANMSTSMGIMPDLSVRKCTVKLDADYNQIGRLTLEGVLELNQSKLDWWVKGHKRIICLDCVVKPMCMSRRCPLRPQETSDTACLYQQYLLKSVARNNARRLTKV
jgi:uncharacterized protein